MSFSYVAISIFGFNIEKCEKQTFLRKIPYIHVSILLLISEMLSRAQKFQYHNEAKAIFKVYFKNSSYKTEYLIMKQEKQTLKFDFFR